jgi:hypothetical protein
VSVTPREGAVVATKEDSGRCVLEDNITSKRDTAQHIYTSEPDVKGEKKTLVVKVYYLLESTYIR